MRAKLEEVVRSRRPSNGSAYVTIGADQDATFALVPHGLDTVHGSQRGKCSSRRRLEAHHDGAPRCGERIHRVLGHDAAILNDDHAIAETNGRSPKTPNV